MRLYHAVLNSKISSNLLHLTTQQFYRIAKWVLYVKHKIIKKELASSNFTKEIKRQHDFRNESNITNSKLKTPTVLQMDIIKHLPTKAWTTSNQLVWFARIWIMSASRMLKILNILNRLTQQYLLREKSKCIKITLDCLPRSLLHVRGEIIVLLVLNNSRARSWDLVNTTSGLNWTIIQKLVSMI